MLGFGRLLAPVTAISFGVVVTGNYDQHAMVYRASGVIDSRD